MSETAVKVENLSKSYTINHQGDGSASYSKSLRETISYGIKSFSQKILKSSSESINNPSREQFLALQNVSFEIKQGDRIGVIGRNGAGKSTLLKILSRITEPTSGRISIRGRVASLLEVGTGFHPELTGRENIYLNGAILGMSKIEINQKFDEIIAFAEIEKFLDTPVKRYSSGMYVRLAFAVAAHLEPEILIVDEVLAVGDANFQKKCLGKMEDISQDQGRTVLFVSHNMNAIQRLCSKCVMLERGNLIDFRSTSEVIVRYMSSTSGKASPTEWINLANVPRTSGTGDVRFLGAKYSSLNENTNFQPYTNGPLDFLLDIESNQSRSISRLAIIIFDQHGNKLVNADTVKLGQIIYLNKGSNHVNLRIENLYLNSGIYVVGLWIANDGVFFDYIESSFEMEVIDFVTESYGMKPEIDGVVSCTLKLLTV
ncbi:ABC transporter ATP-binding protein [Pseudanabaena sp. 'Roaring Creek']|uniref:ABC transporter ATP-binding protein n=1 Tax=Pseudanabaena sp. 'Roaring Creek' TaxID=1681830 RepID=UPI0006D797BA|nr:ABC transporter ATP-binding protein [Pseudanabaena sp. 'Roaring Creek']